MITLPYASKSPFKREEAKQIRSLMKIAVPGGKEVLVGDHFDFEFREIESREILESDLEEMVREKAKAAYSALLVPCVVEHGGLIFRDRVKESYPGGLTQPMWDRLGAAGFLKETGGAGRQTIARSVVGYCDGMRVRVFSGDTDGQLADAPVGSREYYWDTIFRPQLPDGSMSNATYAQISDDPSRGVQEKVRLSQSTKAILRLLSYLFEQGPSEFFSV